MGKRILSSAQWFMLLDGILYSAIDHLIQDTKIVEHYVSQLIGYQLAHKKRHTGIKGVWRENISLMVNFLIDPRLENYQAIHLDRGYTLSILRNFQRISRGYEQIFAKAFRAPPEDREAREALIQFHLTVGAKRDILQTVQAVSCLSDAAHEVKRNLVSQFDKWLRAQSYYDAKNHPLNSNADDLYQGYYLAADRAVDHFNLDKGTFQRYLEQWVKKSRNGNHHFYGSAFNVPTGSKANHLYVQLDDTQASVDDPFHLVNAKSERKQMLRLISLVDPGGYAAQALELEKVT